MRKGENGRSKIQQWERKKQYEVHLNRIQSIGSQIRQSPEHQIHRRNLSGAELPLMKKRNSSEFNRQIELQNERIEKKLREIRGRKSAFIKQTKAEKHYLTINLRSRQQSRKHKYSQIQQENDLMVERIVRQRSKGQLFELNESKSPSLKKSRRKKRNSSLILPDLERQPEMPEIGQI